MDGNVSTDSIWNCNSFIYLPTHIPINNYNTLENRDANALVYETRCKHARKIFFNLIWTRDESSSIVNVCLWNIHGMAFQMK